MHTNGRVSLSQLLLSKELRFEAYATLAAFVLSCAFFLYVYPFPNVYADTHAYIVAAETGDFGIYRPPGYSWLLALARLITPNPDGFVIVQLAAYFFSAYFFYCTLHHFFRSGPRLYWKVFFLLFLLSPTCIYLGNFVISDVLFISLTNLWLSCLLWIAGTRRTSAVLLSTLLLLLLLFTRYIALFYPLLTIIALTAAYFRKNKVKLLAFGALQVLVFFGMIYITIRETEKSVGVAVLSGFGGWQKANNALHALPYINVTPAEIRDPEVRALHTFIVANNPADLRPPRDSVVVWFLWSPWGPLKKYMAQSSVGSKRPYLYHWHKVSSGFDKWAGFIIKKYPAQFSRHYLLPNFRVLFDMPNEALFIFPGPTHEMRKWFACNNCKVQPRYRFFHDFLAATASKSFNLLWIFFALALLALLFRKRLGVTPLQYRLLWLVSFFCITYVAMSVYASPIVFRYMLVIRHALLAVPFLVLVQFLPKKINR